MSPLSPLNLALTDDEVVMLRIILDDWMAKWGWQFHWDEKPPSISRAFINKILKFVGSEPLKGDD
jgi:hypothetical protein